MFRLCFPGSAPNLIFAQKPFLIFRGGGESGREGERERESGRERERKKRKRERGRERETTIKA